MVRVTNVTLTHTHTPARASGLPPNPESPPKWLSAHGTVCSGHSA
jgi:hypothetical protein